ncbi:MAG: bifunctional (p)ppGpp synthetase/guanosine-3',5'-bis(diphosphate) 3'-pyrophosphohydrolase [Candidatus Sumerlaeota bacterium]|nr:bifunctional (p)ppGpp synthetase/guanosine-3',5'-bis(diphosphate) 3'-pyrophosphohydrolase [Candidatus Sumerlaeota bacterium]
MSVAPQPSLPSVQDILGEAAPRYAPADLALFERAYVFGEKAHEGQKRRSGEPYFSHCIETMRLLAELRMDPATLTAGLLHDVLEDTPVSLEGLRKEFAQPIPDLVEGVTKLSSLQFHSDHDRQVESLRKMILAMATDVRVIIIKLCDRLHNMRTLEYLSEAKQRAISRSTLDIYAPLANRLGMWRIRGELEDCAMYYLYPAAYAHLRSMVARKRSVRESIVRRSVEGLGEHLAAGGLQPEITGRPKHFYSIYQKMQRQNLSFDEVYDLIALRVITGTVQDCYDIVGRVHALWHPVPGRFKDYVALPKDNGYQSIHTTVIGLGGEVTEIQIRTQEMHRMAEEGIAAHWRYKEGGVSKGQEDKLVWLRRLVDWLQDVRDPDEFMDALKQDLFSDVVFCFTPKGDVIEMPGGSTALDFAYYIHTELGNQCAGARINRKMVPIRTEVKLGDIVEIIRSRTARPSPGWLEIAKTSRALSKIRHYLRSVDFDRNRQTGLDALVKALRARGVEIPAADLPERLERSLPSLRAATYDELLSEIGFGSIAATAVAARLAGEARKEAAAKPAKKSPARSQVIVEGLDNALVRMAICCTPMPGDPIIGFVTRGRGVSIHRGDCPNLLRTIQSGEEAADRLVSVRWNRGEQPDRRVSFRVSAEDRPGLLRDVSQVFAQLGLNIIETNTKSYIRNQKAILKMLVLVQNAEQINVALHRLEGVEGVELVTRVVHKQ